MNKILLVARREYLENLSTKAFWIGILVFPIILTVATVVPALLERSKPVRKFVVVDRSGWLLTDVEKVSLALDYRYLMQVWQAGETPAPAQLEGLVPLIADMPRDQLIVVANAFVAEEDLPPQLASFAPFKAPMRQWWQSCSEEQARDLHRRLSKSLFQRLDAAGRDESALNEALNQEEFFAYIVIGPDPMNSSDGFLYVSKNLTDSDLKEWFQRLVNEAVQPKRFARASIDMNVAQSILAPLTFKDVQISKDGKGVEDVKSKNRARQWVPVAFVYILWISVFSISQMLLTNTIEEKSNRIIEVLLSSVSPMQLMSGKIFGIAATGLTMLGSWILFFLVGSKFGPQALDIKLDFDLSQLAGDPFLLTSFLFYFLFGYLLYGALLVAIGSVCNSLKEAQNLMQPIVLILILPLMVMMPVAKDPNGLLAKALSYFPPFTPFVMMNRAAAPPTVFEYVVTTILLIVSTGFTFWAAGKVFRIGVLMTGKPPKLKEIIGWVRTPTGAMPPTKAE